MTLEDLFRTQKAPYPKWGRGFIEGAGIGPNGQVFGRVPGPTLHLWLFEPLAHVGITAALGRIVSACSFVDGAQFVAFDHTGTLDSSDWEAICPYCWDPWVANVLPADDGG